MFKLLPNLLTLDCQDSAGNDVPDDEDEEDEGEDEDEDEDEDGDENEEPEVTHLIPPCRRKNQTPDIHKYMSARRGRQRTLLRGQRKSGTRNRKIRQSNQAKKSWQRGQAAKIVA